VTWKGHSDDLLPPKKQRRMDSAMSYTESNNPLSSHVPVQHFRMVFKRLYSDNWSSRLVIALSFQTPEKTRPPEDSALRCLSVMVPNCHWVSCMWIYTSSLSLMGVIWSETPPGRVDSPAVSVTLWIAGLTRAGQRAQYLSA
jgi:hypothetical protein